MNEKFNNMNQVDLDLGQEIIYMKKEDKLRLLENFPDLKKRFVENYLDKFADRKEEEAQFWDEFWKRQKEKDTIMYGGQEEGNKGFRSKMISIDDELDEEYGKHNQKSTTL